MSVNLMKYIKRMLYVRLGDFRLKNHKKSAKISDSQKMVG